MQVFHQNELISLLILIIANEYTCTVNPLFSPQGLPMLCALVFPFSLPFGLKKVKPWSQDWLIAAGAYPSFCSMKWLELFLLPWTGCQSIAGHFLAICQVSPTICGYPFIHLGGERHCESKVSRPRTRHNVPGQGWNPDRSLRSRAH